MSDEPRAVVRTATNGNIYLDDPDALDMIQAVEAHNHKIALENCQRTFETNTDRVAHFKQRIADRGDDPEEVVIVILSVDDPHGGPIADALMPDFSWQEIRDRGEAPYARGLAGREGIQSFLDKLDKRAAANLREMDGVAVVVVDHGVAEVFPA